MEACWPLIVLQCKFQKTLIFYYWSDEDKTVDLGIEGKVAIVTGGSNGIGRAAAERFSMEGALVAVVSRTQSDLDQVAHQISELSGNEVLGIAADVSLSLIHI